MKKKKRERRREASLAEVDETKKEAERGLPECEAREDEQRSDEDFEL